SSNSRSSSSSKIVKAAEKPREIDQWNTCERTIKISNIPSWISSEELKIICSAQPIERIHTRDEQSNSCIQTDFDRITIGFCRIRIRPYALVYYSLKSALCNLVNQNLVRSSGIGGLSILISISD
ncbi:unnamed protein product, partial [Rotaria socialis]